ncbi:MAG: metalloregulator ArsR/SmtB family transcription factor [Myxococcota bacterium]
MDLDRSVALLGLLADSTRLRLLHLLEDTELTVAELTRIAELPQSRISTHLGKLRAAGLLTVRRKGNSTLYLFALAAADEAAREVYAWVRQQTQDRTLSRDADRRRDVIAARTSAQPWPDEVAGAMEHHYSPGRTWEALARGVLGLLQLGDVLDVGSGDGVLASLLASRARAVTCLDHSATVLEAARRRLSRTGNVRLVQGDMHALPFADGTFDQVLHFHALTYARDPALAVREAHRVLAPGGDLVVVTLKEHEQADVAAAYSQVNHGFTPDDVASMLTRSGFDVSMCEVTSREKTKPYFEVITAFARRKPGQSQAVA